MINAKKNISITINPLNKNCESLINCKGNGIVYSQNKEIDVEINTILNLNEDSLVKRRKKVIDFAIQSINKIHKNKSDKTWNTTVKKERQKWENRNKKGDYQPFCQAVIRFLDKRINRNKK